MLRPPDNGEKMLLEVNPTADGLLPLVGVCGYFGPSNLLFSSQISASEAHSWF